MENDLETRLRMMQPYKPLLKMLRSLDHVRYKCYGRGWKDLGALSDDIRAYLSDLDIALWIFTQSANSECQCPREDLP